MVHGIVSSCLRSGRSGARREHEGGPAVQDPQEAAKALLPADLDKPMVLRSKDGTRGKRSRTEVSPLAGPAMSSGTGTTHRYDLPAQPYGHALVCVTSETYLRSIQGRHCRFIPKALVQFLPDTCTHHTFYMYIVGCH